jgi:Flp pilus assembly protein TadG
VLLVAVLVLVLFGFAGLAVDLSRLYTASQQLQSAADAAALAAANKVSTEIDPSYPDNPYTVTRQMAVSVALQNNAAGVPVKLSANTANAPDGDIVIGRWDGIEKTFTPDLVDPNAVKVVARRTTTSEGGPIDLIFGPVFEVTGADVGRTGIALMSKVLDPLLLVLHPSAKASLDIGGNGLISLAEGGIQVNSDSNCAIDVNGSSHVSAPMTSTTGTVCAPAGSITGPLYEHVPVVPDPLADVLPDTAAWNAFKASLPKPLGSDGRITDSGTFSPGYYPKGLSVNNSTVVTLAPGSYMFGEEVKMNGDAQLHGTGVTLFIDHGATMDVGGGTTLELGPPSSGTFKGITIFSHRDNTGKDAVSLGGNGVLEVDGIAYVPGGTLAMIGTSIKSIGGVICWKADFWGNGNVTGKKVPPPENYATVYLVQ